MVCATRRAVAAAEIGFVCPIVLVDTISRNRRVSDPLSIRAELVRELASAHGQMLQRGAHRKIADGGATARAGRMSPVSASKGSSSPLEFSADQVE